MIPEFSIVIPIYDRRAFLIQAINSCLGQTVCNIEIVVSDDCSSEDLRSAVEAFQDARIVYYRNSARLGATRNHQQAVSRARGLYVITLNSDDLVLPNCLAVAGQALRKWDNAAAAYFSTTYLTGSTIEGFHEVPHIEFADNKTYLQNSWLEDYHGTTPSSCLFRKSAFDDIGGYRLTLRFAYDWDLYMRFMRKGGGVVFVPEVLSVYRKHPDQMVNGRSIDGLLDILDLWCLPEYSHWSCAAMAGLVLTHCSDTIRKRKSLRPILQNLQKYEQKQRLCSGLPAALLRKAGLFRGSENASTNTNYRMPNGVEAAIQKASAMLKDQSS
jgi:glycosyltransferase involved in cell wall biosynthesis